MRIVLSAMEVVIMGIPNPKKGAVTVVVMVPYLKHVQNAADEDATVAPNAKDMQISQKHVVGVKVMV